MWKRISSPTSSSSRSRRRAPTRGTMSVPWAATQAIASWATVQPLAAAMRRMHPLRIQYEMFSAESPLMRPLTAAAGVALVLKAFELESES